jgi:hypothetical protein
MLKVVSRKALRFLDRRRSTYAEAAVPGDLGRYFPRPEATWLDPHGETIHGLSDLTLDHRFDLLGSGWVRVAHAMRCRGVEGHRFEPGPAARDKDEGVNKANAKESERILALLDDGYTPIDWHVDYRSGYRWDPDDWFLDIPTDDPPGADVKAPWELCRMQHLPRLAFAYALAEAGREGFRSAAAYGKEFRNEWLDFVGSNPPRWGVNWISAMDVAIRAANVLVAHDLFRALGASFDEPFETVFRRSVLEHGRHLLENLDWHPDQRGCHYLANVVGLLFIGAYLPRTDETDAWLAFAHKELVQEGVQQFHRDGGNVEGSTSIHRLSAEMVAYAAALVAALPSDRKETLERFEGEWLPPVFLDRLEKAGEFVLHVVKPSGRMAQIGDNDSGRFLKLQPAVVRMTSAEARARFGHLDDVPDLPAGGDCWVEDPLDHRHLSATLGALFGRRDFLTFGGADAIDGRMAGGLTGGSVFPSYRDPGAVPEAGKVRVEIGRLELPPAPDPGAGDLQEVLEISAPGEDLREGLKLFAYPRFGLYLFRSKRLYLALRCFTPGRWNAHVHNDQLVLELTLDGEDRFRDPGTYLYTPSAERRNAYRSGKAHHAPHVAGEEIASLDKGLFTLEGLPEGQCYYFGSRGFIGAMEGGVWRITRAVSIHANALVVTDSAFFSGEKGKSRALALIDRPESPVPFSPGYGMWER